ncbi:MAG: HD domain-containing phosphohydrolase [bacterium]
MTQIDKTISNIYKEKFKYAFSNLFASKTKHTILVVDDEMENLSLLNRSLRKEFDVLTAQSGMEALELVKQHGTNISIIISDQKMPGMTGTEFLTQAAILYPNIIKMLLTAYTDVDAMVDGVNNCNLFQYINKPFDLDELKLAVDQAVKAYELTLNRNILAKDLRELFFTTVKSISSALDAKDAYTHGHSYRVTMYALILACAMNIDDETKEQIEIAGLMHDIGKIGVPEGILCKAGKLTNDEFDVIKQHPGMGRKILSEINKLDDVSFWLGSHHERWDGKGYPLGLKGDEIPLPARILSVADTYDAMTSNRSYRKGLAHSVAIEEIQKCTGAQFDPEITRIFMELEQVFYSASQEPEKYYNEYSILHKTFNKYIKADDF